MERARNTGRRLIKPRRGMDKVDLERIRKEYWRGFMHGCLIGMSFLFLALLIRSYIFGY